MLSIERSELGGCRLIRRVGAGSMGEVYLAEQVALGNRLVAVKVVRAEDDTPLSDSAIASVERHFVREAQLLGRLTHPNILPVYHSGMDAGYLFLVMQYAPDGSLADAVKGIGPQKLDLPASLAFVVDIIGQVASALQYTHEHGVIHSDVKPGNVLTKIEPDGRWHALLADFGIARSGDTVASRNVVEGTAAYMAPEQFYGNVSAASDQYALGVMAYQLLAGRTPFVGGFLELALAHTREDPASLRALNPAVPAAVEAVILRAIAKQPEERYPSVATFAAELRTAFMGASTIIDASTRAAGVALPNGPQEGPRGATSHTAHPVSWNGAPDVELAPTALIPHARPATAGQRASTRPSRRARRRAMPGLVAVALLLIAVIAAVALRSHIGVSQASSSQGVVVGTGTTPPATDAPSGASATPSPTSPYSAPPGGSYPPPGGSYPPSILTPTPGSTAVPTQEPPSATAPPQPSATSQPSATVAPVPTGQPTAQPQPSATVAPVPTPPTAAPQPTATAVQGSTPAPTTPAAPGPSTAPKGSQVLPGRSGGIP